MAEPMEFICIVCPVGCRIMAQVADGELLAIEGQACARGHEFVREELTAPTRMFTSTVRVEGGVLPLVPVRSAAPLPKEALLRVAEATRRVRLCAPVSERQVVLADVLGTGVDIIASRDLPATGDERGALTPAANV